MRKINEKTIDSYLDMWGLKRKTPYINNRTKFEIGCPNGHSFFITYNNLLKRKKVECKECENLKKYTHFKETLEKEVQELKERQLGREELYAKLKEDSKVRWHRDEYKKLLKRFDEYYNKLEQKIADKEQQIAELTKLLEVLN